jgi:hypothetical protein
VSENIVDRIVKLLRLAKSPHPAEAEAALRKAYELAAQHRIDIARCQTSAGQAETSIREDRTPLTRWSCEQKYARKLVQLYFDVSVVDSARATGEIIWVGVPENMAIAQHIFAFTVAACRRSMKANRHVCRTLNQKRSFVRSFFSGLSLVLDQNPIRNDQQADALVLADRARRERYIELHMDTKPQIVGGLDPDRRSAAAATAGYMAGRDTPLKRPLTASDDSAAIGMRGAMLIAGGGL